MGLLHTRITNPRPVGCAYGWFPGGLRLAGGESIEVDFDPFTALPANSSDLPQLMMDLKQGFVKFEYRAEAPCTMKAVNKPVSTQPLPPPPPPPSTPAHSDAPVLVTGPAGIKPVTPPPPPPLPEPKPVPETPVVSWPGIVVPKEAVEAAVVEAAVVEAPVEAIQDIPTKAPMQPEAISDEWSGLSRRQRGKRQRGQSKTQESAPGEAPATAPESEEQQ